MTDLPALSYLHPNHPLLREIQKRDFEIARLHRVIAAARRRQEAAQEPAYRSQ